MAPTYLTEETEAEKIGKAQAAAEQAKENMKKGDLTDADMEANAAMIPKDVRAAFATKIWTLLALQMTSSFLISLAVEASVDKPEDPAKAVYIWCGSSVGCFIVLGFLRCFRQKTPCNYFWLIIAIFATGGFWGITKFVVQGFFNLFTTGICTISLVLSALLHNCGITDSLAEKMKPKNGQARPSRTSIPQAELDNMAGKEYEWKSKPKFGKDNKSKSSLGRARDTMSETKNLAIAELRNSNDGVMRATMFLGVITWLIGALISLALTEAMIRVYDEGINFKRGTLKHADMYVTAAACLLSFFMLLFFHYDCERQMRKCNLDEYMKALCQVNSDIVIIFVVAYAVAMVLVCNEQAMEMGGMDGGGGGDMGGGMDGGAGGDVGGDMGGGDMGGDAGGADGGGDMGGDGGGDAPAPEEPPPPEDVDDLLGTAGV